MARFHRIYVELTNRCGQACDFCPPKTQPNRTLSLAEVELLAPQLAHHTRTVACHVMGDPLMIPNLGDYLDILQRFGLQAELTSSGFPMQHSGTQILHHPAIRQINFSLHAYEANHSKISMVQYLQPILAFCDGPRSSFVNLRIWMEGNEALIQSLKHHYGVTIRPERLTQLAPYVRLHREVPFEWPSLDSIQESDGFCHGLSGQIGILADGTVVPCCLDKDGIINLGNVLDDSLESILASSRAVAICEGFAHGQAVESLCRKCCYKSRFSTAAASAQTA